MVNKCIKRRLISLVTGKYKLKQYCREFWPYLSTVIKGNNLIFIESLFCVRRCADSSLNINSALNLYRNLENQKQTVFLFNYRKQQLRKVSNLPGVHSAPKGRAGLRPRLPSSPDTGFSRIRSRRYLMLEYGALGKLWTPSKRRGME